MNAKLLSLGLLAATLPAAEPANQWSTFQDPFEHAFTIEVPQGWTVKGGLFRLGYSDARSMIDLVSPDGRINLRLGDVAIPVYALPNQFHREGQINDLGAQAQLTVARYHSGQDFAAAYGPARFGSICSSLTSQSIDSEPPVLDYIPDQTAPQTSSDGQTAYSCTNAGSNPRTAYVYSKTALYQGFWAVHTLASFVAPAGQVPAVRSILVHCAQSLKIAPQWIEFQKRMDEEALAYQRQRQQNRWRQLSMEVAQFEAKMQSMQTQVNAFERGQARQAAQVQSFTNVLTGITPTIDPYGNHQDVWTGSKNGYWKNGLGQVINSDVSPGAGWQQLQVRP